MKKLMSKYLTKSFFTILLLTANTKSQAVRERTSELGVLKSIGYSDRKIMLFVILEAPDNHHDDDGYVAFQTPKLDKHM